MDEYDEDSPISPLDENEPIDFSLVYALHTFVATLEGQVCVIRGDNLQLLDDSNSYWWLVKCVKTDEIGYIPAENIETPYERLARLNRQRNAKPPDLSLFDASPTRSRKRINIKFAAEPLVIYQDGETESGVYYDEIVDDDESSFEHVEPNQDVKKGPKKSFRESFLGLLKRPGSKKETPVIETQLSEQDLSQLAEPINVLRIFAGIFVNNMLGNVDLKATFKTISVTKNMIISDLVEAALKKFRADGANPSEYYLSEKRIPETDLVYDVLESLRHRSLPGVGDFAKISHARMKQGKISSVRVNDDNIIKIIINKKLNLFDKNMHLMRVFMYDESDPTGKIRYYKTVGVDGQASVSTVISMSVKKFKLDTNGWKYSLYSLFNDKGLVAFNTETMRNEDEIIINILEMGAGSADDIDFVLKREWAGVGKIPMAVTSSIQQDAADSLKLIMEEKPSFLEERPQNGSFDSLRDTRLSDMSAVNSTNALFQLPSSSPAVLSASPLLQEATPSSNGSSRDSPEGRQPPSKHASDATITPRRVEEIADGITAPPRKGSLHTAEQKRLPPTPPEGVIEPVKQYMEEYVAEILKPEIDTQKLEQLETKLQQTLPLKTAPTRSDSTSSTYNDSGLSILAQQLPRNSRTGSSVKDSAPVMTRMGSYDDSGLSNLLTRKTSGSNPSGRKPSKGARPTSMQTSTINSLKGLFDGLEAELDFYKGESEAEDSVASTALLENAEKELDGLVSAAVEVYTKKE